MSEAKSSVVINGWSIFAHPLFLDQLEALRDEVGRAKVKDPAGFTRKNCAKRLRTIVDLAFKEIPQDPSHRDYLQGDTLGDDRKHWFRAKFFQQYRLFFRYRRDLKFIVYAWVNDDETKRAYGSKSDAYSVFARMLNKGKPPDDWGQLLNEAEAATSRLAELNPAPQPITAT